MRLAWLEEIRGAGRGTHGEAALRGELLDEPIAP